MSSVGNTQGNGAVQGPLPNRWTLNDPAPPQDQSLPQPVINRRAGYSLPNSLQPAPEPANTRRESDMITALQHQLRTPWATGQTIITYYLHRAGWDVNRAAELFWKEQGGSRVTPLAPVPHRDAAYGATVQVARIRQITVTRKGVERLVANPQHVLPQSVELAWLLHTNKWQPVGQQLIERNGNFSDLIDELTAWSCPPTGQDDKDERLALLISITSAIGMTRECSLSNTTGALQVLNAWVRNGGIPRVRQPTRRDRAAGTRFSRIFQGGHRVFAADKPGRIPRGSTVLPLQDFPAVLAHNAAANDNDDDDIDLAESGDDDGWEDADRSERDEGKGYVVDQDRTPARLHCPDASKLRIEKVYKGQLKTAVFDKETQRRGQGLHFRWNDYLAHNDPAEIEFDWSDSTHISTLNRWRTQIFRRSSLPLARESAIPFNQQETDWMVDQECRRAELRLEETGSMYPPRLRPGELDALHRRFNDTFAGHRYYTHRTYYNNTQYRDRTIDMVAPRPRRTAPTLQLHRHRIPVLQEMFGIKANQRT